MNDSTIFISLSEPADSIKVIGQNHTTLKTSFQDTSLEYTMGAGESYARIIAYFPEGEVIYTNPFARYNKSLGEYPTTNSAHSVNITLTILYNLLLAMLFGATIAATYRLWSKNRDDE